MAASSVVVNFWLVARVDVEQGTLEASGTVPILPAGDYFLFANENDIFRSEVFRVS